MLVLLNYLSVFIFALDASLNAAAQKRNFLETLFIAIITTFGGGAIIRDIIILHQLPGCLNDLTDIILCVTIASLLYLLCSWEAHKILCVSPMLKIRYVLDKLGTATFIVMGLTKGMSNNLPLLLVIMCGVAPGVGGGTLAKMLYESPYIVLKSRLKDIICAFLVGLFTCPIAVNFGNNTILIPYAFVFTLALYYVADNTKCIKDNLYTASAELGSCLFTSAIPVYMGINVVSGYCYVNDKSVFQKRFKVSCYVSRYGRYRYVASSC